LHATSLQSPKKLHPDPIEKIAEIEVNIKEAGKINLSRHASGNYVTKTVNAVVLQDSLAFHWQARVTLQADF